MKQKSQISLFFILGLILVLGTGIFFFIQRQSSEIADSDQVIIAEDSGEVTNLVSSCLGDIANPLVEEIAYRGGTFIPQPGKQYVKTFYPYHCEYEYGKGCVNKVLTLKNIQKELSEKVLEGLPSCLQLSEFKELGYEFTASDMEVETRVSQDEVTFILTFPLSFTQGSQLQDLDTFFFQTPLPLGKLVSLANTILNDEIKSSFDESKFMKETFGEIIVEKHQPYPDVVYTLKTKKPNNNLEFNFAIEGFDTIKVLNLPLIENNFEYCRTSDRRCYNNVKRDICFANGGTSSPDELTNCPTYTSQKLDCGGRPCDNCDTKQHGESWCEYDGIAGAGFDPVGSRHFKKTCVDGQVQNTECRDYREEFCTESVDTKEAVCRINRWRDCSSQTDPNACLDDTKRDCYWAPYLSKSFPYRTVSYDYSKRKCFPDVPPGLPHWEGIGEEVCDMASEQFNCKGKSCPQKWVVSTGEYCYFQGDCGNYFNHLKNFVPGGFSNTQAEPNAWIYGIPLIQTARYVLQFPLHTIEHLPITGTEFLFPEGSPRNMNRLEQFWEARLRAYRPSISIFPPTVEVDLDVLHSSYCDLWQAPIDEPNCGKCMEDSSKPCSEYRCKSIGANCHYQEPNGIGKCSFIPLNIGDIDFTLNSIALITDPVKISDIQSIENPLENFDQGENIEKEEDDFEGVEGFHLKKIIKPWTTIVPILESSHKVQCKMGNSPFVDFRSVPTITNGYVDQIIIPFQANSIQFGNEQSGLSADLITPLQSFQEPDIEKLKQDLKDTIKQLKESNIAIPNLEDLANLDDIDSQLDAQEIDTEQIKEAYQQFKKTTLNLALARESNKDFKFINCKDITGTFDTTFFISYYIDDDVTPPELLDISPKPTETAITPFGLRLEFSEPVECKYDTLDQRYQDMQNSLTCPWFTQDGSYSCNSILISSSPIFVRCIDQPQKERSYKIKVNPGLLMGFRGFTVPGTNLAISNFGNTFESNTLIIPQPSFMEGVEESIITNVSSTPVEFTFPKEQICRFSSSDISFEEMTSSLSCTPSNPQSVCTAFLPSDNPSNYYFKCKNKLLVPRNSNEDAFKITFSS